ncbi:hypothetical protein AB0F91_22980 [Amycolatopsis sp. NPDC023774]|uniref:hypothetical protein n=1 Tax=Amycolatopsis sp. NPDC023774 TaxID=3155015 RepID=UPI0033ED7D87
MHGDSATGEKPREHRFPLNLFSIPFGLAGLAGTWTSAVAALGVSVVVADALWVVAA